MLSFLSMRSTAPRITRGPVVRSDETLGPKLGQDLRHPAQGTIDLPGNGMLTLRLPGIDE
jgi:hypothetical protein